MKHQTFFLRLSSILSLAVLLLTQLFTANATSVTAQADCPPEIGDGASSPAVRQAMCDAYLRSGGGGPDGVGEINTAIAGGKVHGWWKNTVEDPNDYQIQDFKGGSNDPVGATLVYTPSVRKAFFVRGVILWPYLAINKDENGNVSPNNGPKSWVGGPISDVKVTPSYYTDFSAGQPIQYFERGFIATHTLNGIGPYPHLPAICNVSLSVNRDGNTAVLHASTNAKRAPGYPAANNDSDPFSVYFVVVMPDGRRDWRQMDEDTLTHFSIDWPDLPLDTGIWFYLDAWNRRGTGLDPFGNPRPDQDWGWKPRYSAYPAKIAALPDHLDDGSHQWYGSFASLRSIQLTDGEHQTLPNDNFFCGGSSGGGGGDVGEGGFVNQPPVAELGAAHKVFEVGGELGESYIIPFDASASYDPDGGDITRYWFTFGKMDENGLYILTRSATQAPLSFSGDSPRSSDYLERIPELKRLIANGEQDSGNWKICVEVKDDEGTDSPYDCQIITLHYKDTDQDGLSDVYEETHSLSPDNPDTDGDGIVDYLDRDSDGDGLSDGFEKTVHSDPNKPLPYYWENINIPAPILYPDVFDAYILTALNPQCKGIVLPDNRYKTKTGVTCEFPGPTIQNKDTGKVANGNVSATFIIREVPRYQTDGRLSNDPQLEFYVMPDLSSEYNLMPFIALNEMTVTSVFGFDRNFNQKLTSLKDLGITQPVVEKYPSASKDTAPGFSISIDTPLFNFSYSPASVTLGLGIKGLGASIAVPTSSTSLSIQPTYQMIDQESLVGIKSAQEVNLSQEHRSYSTISWYQTMEDLSYKVPVTLAHIGQDRDFTSVLRVQLDSTIIWKTLSREKIVQINRFPYEVYIVITEDAAGMASIQGIYAADQKTSSVSRGKDNAALSTAGSPIQQSDVPAINADLRITNENTSTDSDGFVDAIQMEVRSSQELPAGDYMITYHLEDAQQSAITVQSQPLQLTEGTRTFSAVIPSADVRRDGESGALTIQDLLVVNANGDLVAQLREPYITQAYDLTTFAPLAVEIQSTALTPNPLDLDQDGGFDVLEVHVPVMVSEPGQYRISGLLKGSLGVSDRADEWVDLASGAQEVVLKFSAAELRKIHESGPLALIDLRIETINALIDRVDALTGAENFTAGQFDLPSVSVMPGSFSDHGWDTDGNGSFDFLVVDFTVDVTDPGTYDLTSLLGGASGSLIRSHWDNFDLKAGANPIQMLFDGRAIGTSGAYSPYVIEQITATNAATQAVVMRSENVYQTQAYTGDQFAQGIVVKDVTPPVINLTLSDPITRVDNQYVFWSVDDNPGPEGIACGVDEVTATLNGQPVENGFPINPFWWNLGRYTVQVNASDCAGNTASQTLTWDMIATLPSLHKTVERLCYWEEIPFHTLDTSICGSLLIKIDQAIIHDSRGQQGVAANLLTALVNEINAQDSKKISTRGAGILRMDALYIIDRLDGVPLPEPAPAFNLVPANADTYWWKNQDSLSIIGPTGGRIQSVDATTVVDVRALSVLEDTSFTLDGRSWSGHPNGRLSPAGSSFELNATGSQGSPVTAFESPLAFTLRFTPGSAAEKYPEVQKLYRWDPVSSTWQDAAETCVPASIYQRDPANGEISVEVCQAGEFALMTTRQGYLLYLPSMLR